LMWHFKQQQKWQWRWQRRQWWWQRRQWLQQRRQWPQGHHWKTGFIRTPLKDWLRTSMRTLLKDWLCTSIRISSTKSPFFLHTLSSSSTWNFSPSCLLTFLSPYLLTFVPFHCRTTWQSYNLTTLFTLFTTNFLDYSAWLLTSSPTTAKYSKKLFCCEYHTFCK